MSGSDDGKLMYGNLLPKITILRPKVTFYVSERVIVVCFYKKYY